MTESQVRSAAARARWARTADRQASTLAARIAARQRLDDQLTAEIDPDGTLTPEDRDRALREARSEHYRQLRQAGIAKQRTRR